MAKIVTLKELSKVLDAHKTKGEKIVFTNGCFDIIHVGHVRYLREAKALGDILVVAMNSDLSIREIKGPNRPITPQTERADVLSELSSIDYVTVFDEPTPLKVIEEVKPDILVKGEDWKEDEIVGTDVVKAAGGSVVRIKLVEGASTTRVIERIIAKTKNSNF
jgi:rfaE bifunctional protein nucleotidyltransferase chain/domain